MVWVVNATPRPIYPRERPGTHCIGGWVDITAGTILLWYSYGTVLLWYSYGTVLLW